MNGKSGEKVFQPQRHWHNFCPRETMLNLTHAIRPVKMEISSRTRAKRAEHDDWAWAEDAVTVGSIDEEKANLLHSPNGRWISAGVGNCVANSVWLLTDSSHPAA